MRIMWSSGNYLHIFIWFDSDTLDSLLFLFLYRFCYHALLCMWHKVNVIVLWLHLQYIYKTMSFHHPVHNKSGKRISDFRWISDDGQNTGMSRPCCLSLKTFHWKFPGLPLTCITLRVLLHRNCCGWGVSHCVDLTEEYFVAGKPPLNERADHFALF